MAHNPDTTTLPDAVRDASPAVGLVFTAIRDCGPISPTAIQSGWGLSHATVSTATTELSEAGLVEQRRDAGDARMVRYALR